MPSALWIVEKFELQSSILPWSESNHFPISLTLQSAQYSSDSKSSFKFQAIWFKHQDFLPLLQIWWHQAPKVEGTFQYRFYQKMRFIKTQIKEWNITTFKNIFSQKEIVSKQFHDINEHIIQNGMDSTTFHHQLLLQSEWEEISAREEIFWRQKSRELCLKKGDQNTNKIHHLA